MGNGLSYAHLAPLSLAVNSKAINALLHLICERDVKLTAFQAQKAGQERRLT